MSRGAGFADHMCHGRRSLRDRGGGEGSSSPQFKQKITKRYNKSSFSELQDLKILGGALLALAFKTVSLAGISFIRAYSPALVYTLC